MPCCCSATRAVALLAEARAHALAGARTAADRAAVLGDDSMQHLMQQLQDRMLAIASDSGAEFTPGLDFQVHYSVSHACVTQQSAT